MKYRKEVDGLRALAVVPVIVSHSGFSLFPGGFTGVDVFFVISGYLITKILDQEISKGTFYFREFYERRARRILPTLLLVIFFSIIVGGCLLTPAEFSELRWLSLLAIAFSSNIYLSSGIGYFTPASELNALIHTWSLGLEEQFYILYPVFNFWMFKRNKNNIRVVVFIMCITGLALAYWGTVKHPDYAFYLLPFRSWELLLGALVARCTTLSFESSKTGTLVREMIGIFGICLILAGYFFIDSTMKFPGLVVLLPCLGTAFVLHFSTSETVSGRLLSSSILVRVGLMSYGLYLWHQPIFTFLRYSKIGSTYAQPSEMQMVLAIIITIMIAYITWKFVEVPIRRKLFIKTSRAFMFSLLFAISVISFSTIAAENFLLLNYPKNIEFESMGQRLEKVGDVCDMQNIHGYDGLIGCDFGDLNSPRKVILYGDSHAQAVSYFLDKHFKRLKIRGVRARLAGCHIVPGVMDSNQPASTIGRCREALGVLTRFIIAERADVVVIARWTFRMYPVPGLIESLDFVSSEGVKERPNKARVYVAMNELGKLKTDASGKSAAIEEFLTSLLSTGRHIYLVHSVPEIGTDVFRANSEYQKATGRVLKEISIPYADYKERNEFVEEVFNAFDGRPRFHSIRPERFFCDTFVSGRCAAQFAGLPYYLDDDHLSDRGAELLLGSLFQ